METLCFDCSAEKQLMIKIIQSAVDVAGLAMKDVVVCVTDCVVIAR